DDHGRPADAARRSHRGMDGHRDARLGRRSPRRPEPRGVRRRREVYAMTDAKTILVAYTRGDRPGTWNHRAEGPLDVDDDELVERAADILMGAFASIWKPRCCMSSRRTRSSSS